MLLLLGNWLMLQREAQKGLAQHEIPATKLGYCTWLQKVQFPGEWEQTLPPTPHELWRIDTAWDSCYTVKQPSIDQLTSDNHFCYSGPFEGTLNSQTREEKGKNPSS
jgi:hypothetical protein